MMAIAITCSVAVPGAYANPLEDLGNAISNGVNGITQQLFGITLLSDGEPELYAVGDEVEKSAVADRDSTNDWSTVLAEDGQVSTQNIGRIWTDKSVFTDSYKFEGSIADTIDKAEGSDFLVGLSALSSTSNLKTVTTTTTPLDIVLVLDVSGSMDQEMGEVYSETYNPNTSYWAPAYYIQRDNGEYVEVQHTDGGWGQQAGWYYTTGWGERHYVTPKTSAADSYPDHVQFYTAQTVSKMESLKSAANQFIDSVNTMNAAIPEGDEQHRIAIVKYADDSFHYTIGNNRDAPGDRTYNYTQVMSDFSTNATDLKDDIDSINAGGATSSDYGLTMAQHVFDGGTYQAGWNDSNEGSGTYVGAREGAKKVLIFFTDGEPNHSRDWDGTVAATSVNLAHEMKTEGTTIYTIGVVDGADPDNTTSNLNRYLHGVSSNYKDATAANNRWNNLNLGTRTPAPEGSTEVPQYYYAAEDSAQLDQVFQDITTSISEDAASGSPIEDVTTTEGETNPGNLTFNDELGAYMEVAGETMQIVYADQTFTSSQRTSQNIEGGVVYTYPFSGTVHANEAYGDKDADLSGLQIKVTHYDDPAKGDVVESVIPADLIPMRNYDVDTKSGTMTVSATYPVRLFYSVQVKAEAAEQLADPSSAIYTSDYVKNNTNEDGTGVEFYSNLYTNSNGDGFVGDTTATFKPSNGNRFYYFTANTPLYTSNDGSDKQADRSFITGNNTVYYKDTYWVQTGQMTTDPETGEQVPAAKERTEYVALSTSDIRNSVRYQNENQGTGAYLPPQTHNEDKIDGLYADKGENGNPTETAKDTLNPTWTVIQDDNGDNVSVISARMGNNGRLALELPGTLAVSKNVAFGGQYGNTGFDATDYTQDKSYEINITLTGEGDQPVSGTYKAQVKNAQGVVVSDSTDDYFEITFMDGNATHSIKHGETLYIYGLDADAAYEVTETAPGAGFTVAYDDNAKGTIEINKTSSTTVTNTYKLNPTELTGSTDLKVSKTLSNRDWREGDSFTFQIAADQSTPNAPRPEKTTVTIDSTNKDDGASFGNISYSTPGQYVYIISEVVPTEDALTGVTYSRARYRVVVDVKDDGDGTMTATSTMTQIMDDAGNSVENGAAIDTHTAAFTNTYRTSDQGGTANLGGTKHFVDETGATELADWTFDFTLTAVGGYPSDENPGEPGAEGTVYDIDAADVPMPADAQGTSKTVTLSGGAQVFNFGEMTYDGDDVGNTYVYAIVEVTGDNNKMFFDDDTEYVTVTVTETQDGNVAVINAVADRNAADVVFENKYDPDSATLTGNTALGGSKTITGRDMLDGESYDFTLEYVSGADGTTPAGDSWIELPGADGMTDSVTGADKGVETAFTFGDITFNHVGEYKFTISENVPTDEDALGGMTYDDHTCTVTVDVAYDKDSNKLVASVDYGTFSDRAGNEFVNEYESSFNYGTTTAGGLNVSKTLTGRDMLDGEFSFTIAAADVEGNPALTDDKLAEADKNFSNGGANDGVANVMNKLRGITFDQDDAGKTFIYTVDEVDGNLANVGYDANVYTVEIKVVDDNDGTMHTETTVKNADGEQVGEVATWDDQAAEGNTVATVAFKNAYTPDEAELTEGTTTGLKVTKRVTGAPTDVDFNFTLVLTNQPEGSTVGGMTDDGEGNMIATTTVDHNFTAEEVAAGTTAEGLFDTLTFDKAGTYTFYVIENEAQGEGAVESWPAGWKYDTSTRQYTVVVTDENPAHAEDESQPLYDGKLYIQSVNPSSRNQTFTNRYNADPVVVGPGGEKAVSLSKKVEGTAFDGSFGFTLAQVNPDDEKWNNVEFAEGATEATVFDFNRDETKTATFGNITFKAEGDYEFTVSETKVNDAALPEQDGNGWKYDRDADAVTIHVSKVNPVTNEYDGVLHATIEGTASFTNSYAATGELIGQDNLKVTKSFTGRANDAWLESDEFKFNIAPADDDKVSEGVTTADAVTAGNVVMPNPAQITITDEDAAEFAKAFGNITFNEAGTYTFKVSEVLPAEVTADTNWTVDGITYDHNVKTVVVNVADNHAGALTASVDTEKSDVLDFKNTYDTTEITVQSLDLGLEGNKVLTGRDWEKGDTFTFTITKGECTYPNSDTKLPDDVVNATMPQTTSVTITPATDGSDTSSNGTTSAYFAFGDDQTVDVSKFTFTDPGTYRYLIEETNPNVTTPGSGIIGVTYDETTYRLTVVVTDNGDGTMSQTHTIAKQAAGSDEWVDLAEGEDITFTNAFSVDSVAPSFNVYKQFSGSDQAMTDNKFSFVIAPAGWANNTDETDQVDTGLTFDGDNAEHPMPMVDGKVSDTVGSIIRGDVVFGDTTFTHDNVGKTYRYVVSEKQPTDDGTIDGNGLDGATFDDASGKWTYEGVTYDNATHYLYAKVISQQVENPEGSGTYVEAVRVYTAGEAKWNAEQQAVVGDAVFNNTYAASGTLEGVTQLGVTKKVVGAEFDENMSFDFTMKLQKAVAADSQTDIIDGVQVEQGGQMVVMPAGGINATIAGGDGVTDGQKTVGFGKMTFTKAGTYTFVVSENVPDPAEDHWTYDGSKKTITVTVVDNNDGTMTVTPQENYDTTFTNVYYDEDEAKEVTSNNGDGSIAGVGDQLTYTIHWASNAVDPETGEPVSATVTITDKIPDGTKFVSASDDGSDADNDGVVEWNLGTKAYGETGTVTLVVEVEEDAAGTDVINTANVFVNDSEVTTNPVTTTIPGKTLTDESEDNGLQVGDELAYTISYANTTGAEAKMSIEDTLPDGVTYVVNSWADSGNTGFTFKQDGQKLTWSVDSAAADARGTISFKVVVNEQATTVENPIDNTAYVTVGDHTYKTNTVGDGEKPKTADLTVSKIIKLTEGQGTTIDEDKSFNFTIVLTDAQGNKLVNGYEATVHASNGQDYTFNVGNEGVADAQDKFELKHGESIVITGLPEGAQYTVTEAAANGYTADATEKTGTITADGAIEEFVNTYKTETEDFDPNDANAGVAVTKVMEGNGEGEQMALNGYTFQMSVENTTVGAEATDGFKIGDTEDATVTATSDDEGGVHFDNITFSQVGTYKVTVTEQKPVDEDENAELPGFQSGNVTYDEHTFTYVVNVTDQGNGQLVAAVNTQSISGEPTFTNVYYNPDDAKSGEDSTPDTGIQVGDVMTYTIEYINVTDQASDMVITDKVPAGITVDEASISGGGEFDAETNTITWTILSVGAGKGGTVTFSGTVNQTAVVEGNVNNTATIKIGENSFDTNTVPGPVGSGSLTISKTVTVNEEQGVQIDTKHEFDFTVEIKDASGKALSGTYEAEYSASEEPGTLAFDENGQATVTLKHDESVTLKGLPDGATYTVTENLDNAASGDDDYGYTQAAPADDAAAEGAIEDGKTAAAAFENAYNADPGDVPSTGETDKAFNLTKQLTGRDENNSWSADDEFSFTLTPGKATDLDGNEVEGLTVPMPADSADGIKKVTVGADKADENGIAPIDFGAIRYERTGIYTYTVQETGANGELGTGGSADGITYDGRTVTITVTVTDNGTGGLVAAVAKTDEAETASFVNTYNSTVTYNAEGVGGLDVTKVLNNRDMTAGQFTFTVTSTGDAAKKIGGDELRMNSVASDAGKAASVANNPFNSITFDRNDSGVDFVYTIVEDQKDGNGYICDTSTYTVTITPTDNGDGTMRVSTVVVDSDGDHSMTVEDATAAGKKVATVPFENTYDAGNVTVGAEGDATIIATKVLENDDIANYAGEFTFKVTSGDTVVANGSNNADGSITFDTITYTSENLYAAAHTQGGSDEVGTASLDTTGDKDVYTFVYNVTEETPTVGGVSYTSGNGSVTITVTDDRAGKLSIDVAYNSEADSLEFVNTYGTGEAAEVTLDGNKTLTGKDGAIAPELKDGMFEFTITGENGAPMPETTTVGNEGSAISFGPIKYTMENVFGTDGSDEATVTEEETAETTDEVATESEATDEIVAGETATAENEGVETYTAGRTKTFIYTITETNGGNTINGITYDGAAKAVEVTVTDEGDGKISAKVTNVAEGTDENMDFTFDNTYAVEDEPSTPTGDGALTITKKLSGRDMKAGEFAFRLVEKVEEDAQTYTATNDDKGNVSFDPITFTKAGEYTYTLTEVVPDGAKHVDGGYEKDGVFYPSVSYTVTATVTDNHDGTLTVVWSMADGAGEPATEAVFENTYAAAPTSAKLEAAKALEGRAVQKDEFSFKLFDADGNVVDEATNDENGVISFDSLTFEKAGTYTYTVSEVVPEEDQDPDTDGVQNGGITYDQTVYTVEIVVTDNGKGNLVVDFTTYKIGDEVAKALLFTNIYKTQPTDPTDPTDDESWLKVTKEFANRDLKAGEFTFQMRYVSGGNADAVTPKSITTTNDANGNVVFDQEGNTGFVFSEEGVYTFIISEIEGDDANIDYDDTEYTVVAKVTKNAETGELEVVWQLLNAEGNVVEEDPSITFHNVYEEPVTPPTPVDPDPSDPSKPGGDVDKKLTGRDLVDGEFSFTITVSSDNASHVSPKSLTGTNDASGNVTFGGKGFVFDEAGDYTFIVAEVLPSDDDPDTEGVQHNGVTYDPATFTITAHVAEENGKLVVTWENADVPMVFENEYEPEETVDITFGATKVLEGRDLAAGEFSFELRDRDGNVVATATNAADGSIVFTSPVTFTEPGEYTYTIVEVSGSVSGVTYDDAVHTAVVTVTDNGDGTLSATVTYDGSGKLPVFTNVFTPSEPGKPEKPSKPGIPQTGDFSAAVIGGTGLAAVALIATGLYLRRRNSH